MPFWRGSQYDLQSRRAIAANVSGESAGILPQLLGKDNLPNGVGGEVQRDFPNPSFNVIVAQSRIARQANTPAETAGVLPQLLNKDKFFRGPGQGPAYDYPNPSFTVLAKTALVAGFAAAIGVGNLLPLHTVSAPVGEQSCDNPPSIAQTIQRRQWNAAVATDQGVGWNAYDLTLVGQDTVYGAPGEVPAYDWPNPSQTNVLKQGSVARTAADIGQWASPTPELVGPPQEFPIGGASFDLPTAAPARSRDYTFSGRYTLELIGQDQLPTGKAAFDLPPTSAARAREYSQTGAFFHGLDGQDAFPAGEQSFDLPARGPLHAREYTQTASYTIELIGKDQLPVGEASFDTPPAGAPRARDYSFTGRYVLELIAQDAFPSGEQLSGNAPSAAPRASCLVESGSNQTIILTAGVASVPPGQSTQPSDLTPRGVPRAREYGQTASFPLELIGQDRFAAGQQLSGNAPSGAARARDYTWLQTFDVETLGPPQQFPIGATAFDLPPAAPQRSRDYSFSLAFFHGLDGQDAMAAGEQAFDLPPRAAARSRDYSFTGSYTLELIGRDAFPSGEPSFDLPFPPGAARVRDYSFSLSFPLQLIGRDQMVAGEQLSGNPPAAAPRASSLSDPGSNLTAILTATAAAIPPGQDTNVTELPPRVPLRARDYSFTASYTLELIGKDQLPIGASTQDTSAPPAGPPRARDYSFSSTTFPGLIGRDKFFSAPGQGPVYDYPNPHGAARAREYGHTSSFALNVSQQLPAGNGSTAQTEFPPRGPSRARDYTSLGSYTLELIGRDQLPTGDALSGNPPAAPQRASTLTYPGVNTLAVQPIVAPVGQQSFDLPPTAPQRARDYTQVASFQMVPVMPTGAQHFDLPPRARLRSREYGATASFPPELNAPVGARMFDSPPAGPARAREYGQTFSFPLELVGQDQIVVGRSTAPTDLPPRGPARSRDYTWSQRISNALFNQAYGLAPPPTATFVAYGPTAAFSAYGPSASLTPYGPFSTLTPYGPSATLVPNGPSATLQ